MTTFKTTSARGSTGSRLKVGGAIATVAIVAVASGGLFYLFGRSTPAAVSIGDSSTLEDSTTDQATTGEAVAGDLSGTWTIDTSIGSFSDYTSSFVGYRVQEELANVGAATAVGRTADVTGTLVLDGTTITSAQIEADLTTLRSDNDMRDGQLERQGLETGTYPTATFALTEPIELGQLPAEGESIRVTATGELTLHGVTQAVEIPLEVDLSDGVVTVIGSLDIAFADYGIPTPQSMLVLSIADEGVMEIQLHFTQA
jgi:polyisoprenoid-binding protein YceI